MITTPLPLPAIALALALPGTGGHAATAPARPPDPAAFSARVTNPWFPLRPGTTYRYRGTKDGKPAVDVLRVTHRTRRIDGVRNVVVADRLYLNGRLAERTTDYYCQDRRGNVWYFGEDTATLRADGTVESREGSFHAGRAGAQAGIYLTGHPRVGQTRRQELFKGHAEDSFTIRNLDARVQVPYGRFSGALRTTEHTPLEPRVLDEKYYVRGVGTVLENQLKGPGPHERLALVAFRPGG